MKYLILFLIPLSINAKTIKDGDTEYKCNPVKTCDQKLKTAYAEIARLKKQVKVVYVDRTVEKIVEKTVIKKHLVSVSAINSVDSIEANKSGNTATALAQSAYKPLITYQYQTNSGITPLIGLTFSFQPRLMLGLGYEFN
jgi:hypothetical protein